MLNWILILLGIIATQALVLNIRFSDRAKGYLLRSAIWIWPFLTVALIIEATIATVLFHLINLLGSRFAPLPQELLSIFVGIMAVLLPNTFEYFLFYRNVGPEKARNPLVRAVWELNLAIIHKFARAIRTRMEQDNVDCQTMGWGLGYDREEIGRRLRKIYAYPMMDIAWKKRKPELLDRDVDVWPYEQFYLLAEHLGRRRLRKAVKSPPKMKWDGHERRRIKDGSLADRVIEDAGDQAGLSPRRSDDQQLRQRISDGERLISGDK